MVRKHIKPPIPRGMGGFLARSGVASFAGDVAGVFGCFSAVEFDAVGRFDLLGGGTAGIVEFFRIGIAHIGGGYFGGSWFGSRGSLLHGSGCGRLGGFRWSSGRINRRCGWLNGGGGCWRVSCLIGWFRWQCCGRLVRIWARQSAAGLGR